jgi:lauroyl/myristoyl acyltransferase
MRSPRAQPGCSPGTHPEGEMTARNAAAGDERADAIEPVRGTMVQRLRARAVAAAAWLVCQLPERPLLQVADLGGELAYRTGGPRRDRARANLGRVAAWAANTEAGPARLRRAATDPAALERLVRSAFRQHARYWIELLRAPRLSADYIRERVDLSEAAALQDALASGGPVVFIGLHLGAIELPGFYLGRVAKRDAVGPMEAVDDPELRRWFLETRAAMGIRLVGLREARRELVQALRDGAAVGIVADRDLTGGGVLTPLFGHPAPLPAGPAVLVLETDTPTFVVAVRRTGFGRYAARVEPLPLPPTGPRRARAEAFLRAEAEAFERFILDAPEQWWAVLHPIWPDLETGAKEAAA